MRRGRGMLLACVAWCMQIERGHALGRSAKDAGPCREKATLTPVFRPVFHADYVMQIVLRAKVCLAAKSSQIDLRASHQY